ncbi:hypothetical protein OG439_29230 [Amycolatopsis sp. NBC_01307]|uniref:hypothetical protein n=1 Tax=Amycolatopsis sp. NBC_01307 TaxID=2903561 RepID=UPI002E0D7954|nr:hypothetical protein OG439_29230 [Amycolatopsis sp. NBC_01307]
MREPDDETEPTETKSRGLAITAVAIGLTPAVATWAAWVIVRPPAVAVATWTYSWVAQAFVLVLAVVRVAADQRAGTGLRQVRRHALAFPVPWCSRHHRGATSGRRR